MHDVAAGKEEDDVAVGMAVRKCMARTSSPLKWMLSEANGRVTGTSLLAAKVYRPRMFRSLNCGAMYSA